MNRDDLPPSQIFLRAWTTRLQPSKWKARTASPPSLNVVLVLDAETTTDSSQRLLFGSARLYRLRKRTTGISIILRKEWLFHADELPESDPTGYGLLVSYAARGGVQLLSRAEFVEKVFFPLAVKGEFPVVGFNLPFDLSRLAIGWAPSRKTKGRGFSLRLWGRFDESGNWDDHPYRPRVIIEKIAPGRAFMRLTRTKDAPLPQYAEQNRSYGFPGHLLDLQTLTFALTNTRHSLESACRAFNASTGKGHTAEHGRITDAYIDYNRQDVEATSSLLAKLVEEFEKHPIGLPITKAMSPATIGKAYLKAMGVRPPLEKWPDTSEDLLGLSMTAYYGGRAECRIRHVPVPVVTVDFLSMYPTVNTLMGLWWYLIAERIETVDSTEAVRDLLAEVAAKGTAAVLDPSLWRQLVGYVLIQPDGDILPVRANYGDRDDDRPQIGVNPCWSDFPMWYPIADAVASTLATGKPPEIIRAVSLKPIGTQAGLEPLRFRNAIEIRPAEQDFFKAITEERKRVSHRTDLAPEEQARLESGLKTLGNATGYGIFAEMNQKQGDPTKIRVVGLGDPFETTVDHPEDPGAYCDPPLGACIPAGARLMLATLEKLIHDQGGHYAVCDTDAMAIVATRDGGLIPCPGGSHFTDEGLPAINALSWAQVDQIRAEFQPVNPYDREAVPDDLLELEKENYDEMGRRRELWCLATSAKRYALYQHTDTGIQIRKPSEHGLGHLLPPTESPIQWIEDAWKLLIADITETATPELDWLDRPAVAQLVATTPYLLNHFRQHNNQKDYPDQVKPFGFLLSPPHNESQASSSMSNGSTSSPPTKRTQPNGGI